MANGFITYWGNLIPSEFTLRVAKESPGPLRRQSKPAGLAVQADSSRQEPVLLSSVSSKAVTTGTPLELWELVRRIYRVSKQLVKPGLTTRGPPKDCQQLLPPRERKT